MRKVITLCAAVTLLPGCAMLQQLLAASVVPPTLTFKSATLADVTLASATINLTYQLDNPNPVGLQLASVDYAFQVEGKQVVAGRPPNGLRLPASGSAEVVFPANIRFMDIAPVLETFLTKDTATYRAQGSLGIETPLGVITLPLEKQGTFDVPKLPTIQVQPPRVTQLGFTQATIDLPLTVTNRNNFPLPLGGVAGDVRLAGAKVGSISTGDLGLVGAKETRPLSFPITINFLQAGGAAVAALRGGSATVSFDGELRSGEIRVPVALSQNVSFQR